MTRVTIQDFPVFERGVFKEHPELFDPYLYNMPEHLKKRYRQARRALPRYEETVRWQMITGPGFCGATHPGTGKIFHGVMTGATHPVYDSDCLYINPSKGVFAVSDPPGITTFSRRLITELDERLQAGSAESLEAAINEVNRNAGTGLRDRATLSLVHFPRPESGGQPGKALVMAAGDSHLFCGNVSQKRLTRLEADANRWGTPNAYFEMRQVEIADGDFFLIASDGISAVRSGDPETGLDQTLLRRVASDGDDLAYSVTLSCNDVFEDRTRNRVRTAFGGGDDVSVILIDPGKLQPVDSRESYILGGYIG